MDRPPSFVAPRVAGIYTLFGMLWIIASDRLLEMTFRDLHTLTLIQTYKGWAFVLASGLLIFLVLKRELGARSAAEEAVRASEERYRLVFATQKDATVLVDSETFQFVDVNQAAERLWGYPREELLAMNALDVSSEPDKSTLSIQSAGDGQGHDVPLRWHRKKNGTVFPVAISASSIPWNGRRLVCAIAMDISERFRTEEALRDSEERFRNVFEQGPLGIAILDLEYKWISVNPKLCEMLGYTQDDLMNLSFVDIVHPDDIEPDLEQPKKLLSGEIPIDKMEKRCIRKTGEILWTRLAGSIVRDEGGTATYFLVMIEDITDRKKVEDALVKSEERYRTLSDNAPMGIFQATSEGRVRYWNSCMAKMVGVASPEEGVKHFTRLSEQIYADPRRRDEFIKILREKGRVTDFEYEAIRMDGSHRWLTMNARVSERYADGSYFIEGFTYDITEQKLAQEALRDSEEKYRATFNNAAAGMDLINIEGRFLRVNAVLANFLGYTEEELCNLTILDVTHPEDVAESARMHDALVRGETESYKLEKRYVRKDGSIVWVDMFVTAIRDSGGKHIAAVGIVLDTTKKRQLDEIRVRLATAVEQAAEAIVVTDTEGTIRYVNPAFERITGYTADEAIGNNPRLLKSGEHDRKYYENLWETISGGQVWTGGFTNKRKDGSLYQEDSTISPVRDSRGKIINFVAVKRDITAHLELSRQLLQAQKMEAIGTLAGGIAHDFNNLLQVTLGYSELLLADKREDDPERADLLRIFQAAKSGAELVQRLLMFSRKAESKPIPLNLNRQIVQVEKLLRRTIPRMIDIKMDLSDEIGKINADPTQMEQVLMNLAVNARDAMPDKGTLSVRTNNITLDEDYCSTHSEAKPGEYVLLSVSDTGHGMEKETIDHIFEPFYTTKELGRGTGLGLAIVYGIVKQHSGYITCESGVGHGTTFEVYFPVLESQAQPDTEKMGAMPASGTETILLVDDEVFVRDLGARILSKAGYKVLTAANGRDALDLFDKEKTQISLVILDLIMPEMGGKECLEELRSVDPRLKVLIASGYSAGPTEKDTIKMGARGFVSKPFRMKELLGQVRKALDSDG